MTHLLPAVRSVAAVLLVGTFLIICHELLGHYPSALSRIDPGLLRLTDPPTLFPPFVTRCASRGDERAAASGCVGADGDMHTVG